MPPLPCVLGTGRGLCPVVAHVPCPHPLLHRLLTARGMLPAAATCPQVPWGLTRPSCPCRAKQPLSPRNSSFQSRLQVRAKVLLCVSPLSAVPLPAGEQRCEHKARPSALLGPRPSPQHFPIPSKAFTWLACGRDLNTGPERHRSWGERHASAKLRLIFHHIFICSTPGASLKPSTSPGAGKALPFLPLH